jgi:hypothetical protein
MATIRASLLGDTTTAWNGESKSVNGTIERCGRIDRLSQLQGLQPSVLEGFECRPSFSQLIRPLDYLWPLGK